VSVLSTPHLGRWHDSIGPYKALMIAALVQLCGIALLCAFGSNAWAVLIPLFFINLVGPSIDVTGRMTFLTLEPSIRTRLTTSYIVIMFLGGAAGSILGTAIYDWGGWIGACALLLVFSLCISGLSLWTYRNSAQEKPATS